MLFDELLRAFPDFEVTGPAVRGRSTMVAMVSELPLVVASGQDHGEYQSTARRVARLIPNSEVLEMPAVRHWPAFEDPAAFNVAALRFLLS